VASRHFLFLDEDGSSELYLSSGIWCHEGRPIVAKIRTPRPSHQGDTPSRTISCHHERPGLIRLRRGPPFTILGAWDGPTHLKSCSDNGRGHWRCSTAPTIGLMFIGGMTINPPVEANDRNAMTIGDGVGRREFVEYGNALIVSVGVPN